MYDDTPQMDEREKQQQQFAAFVDSLRKKAEKRVEDRRPIEMRMLDDLRQYHGVYDEVTQERLKKKKKSQIFMNLTRPKTNAVIARMWDLLFPSDDRNWGIQPTPVPEMDREIEKQREAAATALEDMETARQRMDQANEAENPAGMEEARLKMNAADQTAKQAQSAADKLHEIKQAAANKALLMQDEIDDQLKASRYGAEARDMIADGCKIGIGVLKGPVVQGKRRRKFQRTEAGYQLTEVDDMAPSAQWVDPWSFFPDPACYDPADGDGVFERHLFSPSKMRQLQKRGDIDPDALRRAIKKGPGTDRAPWYVTELANLTQEKTSVMDDVFTVWEYSGEISGEELELLATALQSAREEYEDRIAETGEIDPLESISVRIWFCDDEILSFAINPLDSQECMYSVWNYERAEHGPYGYGVPFIMRHEQATVNASKRMMMDAGALSAQPQIVINKSMVTPENGEWILEGGKVWLWNSPEDGQSATRPFEAINIPANLNELAGIIDLAQRTIQEITIPSVGQTDQGSVDHQTFRGLALKMGNANVMLRRLVRDFDDQVTRPLISRFYEWNMQFSPKEEIKGDYQVDARGSSVLVVREMQSENLMMIANAFGDHPKYGPILKHKAIMDMIFRALMIPVAEITKTEHEIKEEAQAEQQSPEMQAQAAQMQLQQQEMELKERELQAKVEIANMEATSRKYQADRDFEIAMQRAAIAFNSEQEKLEALEDRAKLEHEGKERRMAVEVAMAQRTGKSAGGAV